MKRGVRGRLILISVMVLLSILFFLPSTPLYSHLPAWWGKYLPSRGIVMGLDLQGGMHLVLSVQGEKAVEGALERSFGAVKSLLDEKKVVVESFVRTDRLLVLTAAKDKIEAQKKEIRQLLDPEDFAWTITDTPTGLTLAIPDAEAKRIRETATAQVLETIRNRIDQFGVNEPLIQQQGEGQVLVQLPGIKDPKRAMELIGRTALLEFKLLDGDAPLARELPQSIPGDQEAATLKMFQDRVPVESQILFERSTDESGRVTKQPYLMKKEAVLTGAMLSDARVSIGEFNTPYVSITFDAAGATQFEKVTAANVQKQLAIVLDNTVYSAPVIQEKIAGGRAQISGTYTTEEANDLAIVLRAGALPAPVEIIQNVTVGPSLGRDSIDAGLRAGIVGTLLIVTFMAFYYRASGMLANFAMGLNILLLIGVMAALNATLTLPGIAGIILTIGMSVDSNVLIFERIRDELRTGKPVRLAIDAGYDKAFSSIFDSHVTTLITSFVLFLFGTGPIKGFAVSLSAGVLINLFTSLVGTKVLFDWILQYKKIERLSV